MILATIICLAILRVSSAGNCTIFKGIEGNCVSILACPSLLQALATLNQKDFDYVKKSQCGHDKVASVCCPISCDVIKTKTSLSASRKTNSSSDDDGRRNLLPSRAYCGYQHSDDYYTSGRSVDEAKLDEFPWLGTMLYTDENGEHIALCACTLINDRYCLTAAHCVNMRGHFKLDAVRLGDFNLANVKDCIQNDQSEECSDPYVEYQIQEILVHPDYNLRYFRNDIALLRLNESVTYSDFIRPICLPVKTTKLAKGGDVVSATGWGIPTKTKVRILMDLFPRDRCATFYNRGSRMFNLTDQHFCTASKNAKDNCEGDSGGPIMFSNRNQWHLEGLSMVVSQCASTSTPNINTNIVGYLDWIGKSLKK